MGRIFNLLKEAWKNRGKHLAVFLKVNNIIIKKKLSTTGIRSVYDLSCDLSRRLFS